MLIYGGIWVNLKNEVFILLSVWIDMHLPESQAGNMNTALKEDGQWYNKTIHGLPTSACELFL